jgi:glutathione S-transferase
MKLHAFPPSPRATKVIALAYHLGLDCDLRLVDLFKGEQNKPEFAALNPNERMPVLEEDGFVLWESNAILQYMAAKKSTSGLWPADARGQADELRWHSWDAADWFPACGILTFERFVKKLTGRGAPDPAEIAKGEAQFHKCAKVLNAALKGRDWLVGNKLTIADFAIGAPMATAIPAEYPLTDYPEITRYYAGLSALPAWQKALAAAHG